MDKTNAPKKLSKKAVLPKEPERDYYIIFLWIIIIIVSCIRYRLITVPFERDEGEYAYIGSLFLHGVAPFKDAYTMKLPGTPFMYSIFMLILGHSNKGVHLGFLFMNCATMYFLFAAFKKIFNSFIGLTVATIYGFIALSNIFLGFAAHATHFICFFSSIALFFLANFMNGGKPLKIFLFGLMLGMAFIMKQQAVFFILFGAIFLAIYLKSEKKQNLPEIIKKLLLFGAGVFIPYSIIVLIIAFSGQFHNFWLWTVEYASQYEKVKGINGDSPMTAVSNYFKITFLPAWSHFYYLWLLALAGIVVLFRSPYTRLQKIFTLIFFIASVCALSAGFYFRAHYYIVLLPALGLLTGIFFEFAVKQLQKRMKIAKPGNIALIILSALILFTIYDNRDYYFTYTPNTVCDLSYLGNPFIEAQTIAKYIKNNTSDTDKIAILGSEPEICFYADRMSATGYLYTYPLVENQPYNEIMQEDMIKEIEKNKPAFLVDCNVYYSWLVRSGAPRYIFEWINKYTRENYSPVLIVDFWGYSGWQFLSVTDSKNLTTRPISSIVIYKRNPYSNKL